MEQEIIGRWGALTVVGNFVASFVHAEEVQVANRLELAIRLAIDGVLGKLRGLELGAVRVVDGVNHELATVPVANPVCKIIVLVMFLLSI